MNIENGRIYGMQLCYSFCDERDEKFKMLKDMSLPIDGIFRKDVFDGIPCPYLIYLISKDKNNIDNYLTSNNINIGNIRSGNVKAYQGWVMSVEDVVKALPEKKLIH